MSELKVDAAKMKTTAQTLTSLNSQFKSSISALETTEASLNKMWDGDANDAFHKAFTKDKAQMTELYNEIAKYISSLNDIITKYETTEKKNTQTATTRTY